METGRVAPDGQAEENNLHNGQGENEEHDSVNEQHEIRDKYPKNVKVGKISEILAGDRKGETHPTFRHIRRKFFWRRARIFPAVVSLKQSVQSLQSTTGSDLFGIGELFICDDKN